MASIFATALTFPSYSNPTNVSTTLVALTGTLTVPDPGFAWTPIVMGAVAFESDSTTVTSIQTGNNTSSYPYLLAQVDVRMGNTNTGTLVASGCGSGAPGNGGGHSYWRTSGNANFVAIQNHSSGVIEVAQQYAAGASVPSYTGSQTLTAWIKKVSGQNNVDTISGTCNLMVYILPTA